MKKLPLVVLLLTAACGGNEKPPVVAATAAPPVEPPTSAPVAEKPRADKMAVNVDDEIMKQCDLKFANIEEAPKFDFDSEQLTQGEKDVLGAVAKCLTTGPLKGRTVDLVGRADPRGETEYNLTLGAKRARAVHSFMTSLGVPSDKMKETSRGELDATGKDEEGWRKDRRVDVRLRK